MDSEDGERFVKHLAQFVRTHEKALANALQLRRQAPKNSQAAVASDALSGPSSNNQSLSSRISTPSTIAAFLSLGTFNFTSQNAKAVKLSLTPHHLYYLLCKIEESGIPIGPMNVRVESIHAEASPANYVSFLTQSKQSAGRSDRDSIHSVSSVRSAMSSMSSLWSSLGIGTRAYGMKNEKTNAQFLMDLKYLYSAFTKIPCLRLSPDYRAHLISGYEEFPFDSAVPLHAFKNVSVLEVSDMDFRQFFGWDRLADQLRSLTVKRARLSDPSELLTTIVLDDMNRRRRRSSKTHSAPTLQWPSSPSMRFNNLARAGSTPGSPIREDELSQSGSPKAVFRFSKHEHPSQGQSSRTKSASPSRPESKAASDGSFRYIQTNTPKIKRSGSTSSNSSSHSSGPLRSNSSSNLLSAVLPVSKWRFLRHLSLPDNALTSLNTASLAPLVDTLHSLDLSSNLFNEIPGSLGNMNALRALNLSNCMIDSLHSLIKNAVPALTALNLRANRLASISGIERLSSLERLDLRENKICDPTELARLTGISHVHEIWVLRNPFVRTHGNYRVTIFNLFRSTPGFTEDIIIDSTGPNYTERRQLKDRAPRIESVGPEDCNVQPRVSIQYAQDGSNFSNFEPMNHQVAGTRSHQNLETRGPPMEFVVDPVRRRKMSRRKIVDLAQDQRPPILHQVHLAKTPNSLEQSATSDGVITPLAKDTTSIPATFYDHKHHLEHPPTLSQSVQASRLTADISNRGKTLVRELQSLNLNGEAYKSRIEALKEEVGSNWMDALGEPVWTGGRLADNAADPLPQYKLSNSPPLRTQSQAIVSGAGTLAS